MELQARPLAYRPVMHALQKACQWPHCLEIGCNKSSYLCYFCWPQVDTNIPGSPSGAEVWLSVAVLMSYEHMGTSVVVRPLCCER